VTGDSRIRSEKPFPQKILVLQQRGSGLSKIQGIREYGRGAFDLEILSIDADLPPVLDEPKIYLPEDIQADLVLDYFKHPDLSYEIASRCSQQQIPVVAKGKKWRRKGVLTPPT
jgi:thymidylate synthase